MVNRLVMVNRLNSSFENDPFLLKAASFLMRNYGD